MIFNSLIRDFLEYLEVEKGHSPLTARNYHLYLKRLADFAKEKGVENPENLDLDLIRKYRLFLNHHQSLSKATQNYHLIALRAFLKYLSLRGIKTLAPDKIELIKTGERQIAFLDDKELEEILGKPDLKTIQGVRDKAILDLLFSTGLRVSELCNLKKGEINLDKSEFSVKGKGNKVRVVFLDQEVKESLKNYLLRRKDKNDYLFISYGHTNSNLKSQISNLKTSITPRSVQRMVRKYAKMAGITKQVTPHVMRHSFATDLLMAGADLRAVQDLLGHKSVTTTQIYTHITDRHLQEVHQAFHGKRRGPETPVQPDSTPVQPDSPPET